MSYQGQMTYTLEQLVRALAHESITADQEEQIYQNANTDTQPKWHSVVKTIVKEIDNLFPSKKITNEVAESNVEKLSSMLEIYNYYPHSHNLLSSIEEYLISSGQDPRPYTTLLVRVLDSVNIKDWHVKRKYR